MRGYCPCNRQSRRNKDRSTLIRHAQQAARATFPLKKGEGMKGRRLSPDTPARKISPLGGLAALLGRNDKKETHLTSRKNRTPEKRSAARFLGRGEAALQVEHFAKWQNADSIGERRRAQGDRWRLPREGARRACGARKGRAARAEVVRANGCLFVMPVL